MSSADLTVLAYISEAVIGQTDATAIKAQNILTMTAAPHDGDTVTLDVKVYTFQTMLTNVDGHILIGATRQLTLLNLLHAVNNSGGVSGTDYAAATTASPTVFGLASDNTTFTAQARTAGSAGNAIATTVSGGGRMTWPVNHLTGGQDFTLQELRYISESIKFDITNTQTTELRPDRTQTDLIQTGAMASGGVNMEFSFKTYEDFIAGALCNSWNTGTGDQYNIQNGAVRESFTIEKIFQDMSIPEYHIFRGMVIDTWDMKMEIGKIVTGSFGFMGMSLTQQEAQIAGATLLPPTTTSPMNAVTNFQNFNIGGVPYTGCISSLGFSIKNNVRSIECLGTLGATDEKLGTIEITGDMSFYFNEGTTFLDYVAGTVFAFSFDLVDGANNRYTFTIPRAKFESGEVVAGGRNTDVMFAAKWRALYDSATGAVIKINANPGP